MKNKLFTKTIFTRRSVVVFAAFCLVFALYSGLTLPDSLTGSRKSSFVPSVKAGSTYHNFTAGSLLLSLTPATVNLITSNDDWSNIASVEGYEGRDMTATHGIDPQTLLGTEFAGNNLPNSPTQVNANKGNPSAYNAGGLTEFDTGSPLAFGFQGNVHANPYMVFYLNTTGHNTVTVSYDVMDIDGGSNNSVSPVALQYRVGQTGNFTNLPAGFVADATDGGVAGRVTSKSVVLPPAANNQPQVQVRLITSNAAAPDGTSTPDEWIGVNNIVISVAPPTAANVSIGGRVYSPYGSPLSNAMVSIYDTQGNLEMTRTNPFGYYSFDNIEVGRTYIVAVSSKRFYFSNSVQVIFVTDAMESLDFFADPIKEKQSRFETFKMKY
jgi:hypothetical protein